MYCFEKTVQFISESGLVYTALQGSSFCSGCLKTFALVLGNPVQMAIQVLASTLLRLLAIFVIPLSCAMVTFRYVSDTIDPPLDQPLYPTIAVFLLAVVVTYNCMAVFACGECTPSESGTWRIATVSHRLDIPPPLFDPDVTALLTIFICCFRDKADYKAKYMSDPLRAAFGFPKREREEDASQEGGSGTKGAEASGEKGGQKSGEGAEAKARTATKSKAQKKAVTQVL